MRIPIGLVWLSMACALGACDDAQPVSGGESGGDTVVDDDDDDDSGGTTASSSDSASASNTATTTSATTTDPMTTGPTPTSMDPTDTVGDSSGDPETTSSGCTPGTQGCECDEGACVGGLTCNDDVCVVDVNCGVDIYEDNNTEATAADLGTITDDDDDAVTITAVLEGDEVDWFTYLGTDSILSSVNPARTLTTAGALRMCKYVECSNDLFATEVTCPEGTVSTESPEGRPGCCGDDSFEIELGCSGVIDDEARVYIRFDQGLGDCTQYTLEYHY